MPPVFALLGSILPTLIDKIFPGDTAEDRLKKAELQAALTTELMKSDLAQIGVNTEEAKSDNLFIAGWRPFVGWVCGIGFFLSAFNPYINLITLHYGWGIVPPLDTLVLEKLLYGLLGFGAYRTAEKINKVRSAKS